MAAGKKIDAYQQALDLVTALYEVNKQELDEVAVGWLESESEIRTASDEEAAMPNPAGKIYEGLFRACQLPGEIAPDRLWTRAQRRAEDEAVKKQTDQTPEKAPLYHRRLLRLYWMVRLAAEDLIEQNPRVRLGKTLIGIEKSLREAFVETDEGIKLPLAMLRKKQWELLAKYGMGLTVDEIYDLRPPRPVIEWNWGNNLFVGMLIGVVIGFILALLLITPASP